MNLGPGRIPVILASLMLTLDFDIAPNSSIIAVAFDTALVSTALDSFLSKGGDTVSFDLVLCLPPETFSDDLEWIWYEKVGAFRTVVESCVELKSPNAEERSQLLYVMIPENRSVVGEMLRRISKVYQVINDSFYSARIGQLLWLPMFLIIWPEFKDHCQNLETSERLIRASIIALNSTELKPLGVDSDVYIFLGTECTQLEDNIWEVYSLNNGLLRVQKLIPDRRKHESLFNAILGRVRRRLDLQGASVKAILSKDPSSFLEAPPPGIPNSLEIVNGTSRIVFTELAESLNFTEEALVGDWLSRYPNDTLKGITATLFRKGMADVTISVSSLLPYRKVELSYLQPTYSNSINGFFVQPSASSFRDIAIAPFTYSLWATVFITYLILLSSILFFGREYGRLNSSNGYFHLPESDLALRSELPLWAVGALAQQGWYIYPESNASRIAFTTGYFLGLVCYGAFSAAVVSILAVEMVPIKSTQELLNSTLIFYADNASSTMAYVVDYLMSHTKINFGNKVNIEEGVARLRGKDPSCYIAFPHYFYLSAETINITEKWVCDKLSVVPVTTTATLSSMVVPRNSIYAELFNFMILRMISRGLNHRFVRLYNEATTWKCSVKSGQVFSPLGIKDVFTAGFILCGGAVTAFLLFLLEKLRNGWVQRGKERETEAGFYD